MAVYQSQIGSDPAPEGSAAVTGTRPRYLRGSDGDSAYELAVKHGYVGTEEEWVQTQIPTVVLTQAEYAALPIPRPTGILYIVTG